MPVSKPHRLLSGHGTCTAPTTIVLLLALVVVTHGQAATSPTARTASPAGQTQREAAPAPPATIRTRLSPSPSTSAPPSGTAAPPANQSDIKKVQKIPISNIVLDPLANSMGDTVIALLKWSNPNDTTIGNNWNLCSSYTIFDNTTANLACKYYGYPGGGYRVENPALLPEKPYMVSLPLFTCPLKVTSFKDCTSGELIKGAACPEADIIVVKCYDEGALRLVGGSEINQGRLQIFWDGAWNNLCSNNIVNTTANTVCSLMGFAATGARRVNTSEYDDGSKRYAEPHVWVPYIDCKGGEPSIKRCFSDSAPYRVNGTSNEKCYTTNADAALVCKPAVKNAARPAAAAAGALWVSVLLAVLYVVAS